MNQDSYNSNSLGFDQPQPLQSPVIHPPPQELSIQEMEDLKQQYLDELKRLSNLEYRDEIKIAELTKNFNGTSIEIQKKEKLLQQEQWAYLSTNPSKCLHSFCYDDDDDDEDCTSAITPDEPVLSTEEPDNSLSMGDEHLDTIPATESDEFIKSSVENLSQSQDFSESNEEFSSIDDDSFFIDDIDYVEASPPDSELISSEVMEIVIPEISSGSPTTHSDSSLYASFIFDLSINLFPPADGSDSYEFTDELIPFISAPEYDCFLFKVEPNSRDFTKDVVEDISPTKEPQVLNTLPTHPILQLNMKFQPSNESLFTYVVWIFLPFLVYLVVPRYLLSLRNEDTIFDPGIFKSTFSRPDISHRCGTVKKFNTHHSHLNTCPMLIHR
nr:hypothetical protein [Tanacetum cinerariifolium]